VFAVVLCCVQVTRIAQAQISAYGMSKKLGNVSYQQGGANGEGESFTKPFSEATAQTIDEEVRLLISSAYERTIHLIGQHAEQVLALAERLIQTETVNHDALVQVLGPRPFVTDAYSQWMSTGAEEAQNRAEKDRRKEEEERKKRAAAAGKRKDSSDDGTSDTPAPQPILNPI
jgi:AFG3 family protein